MEDVTGGRICPALNNPWIDEITVEAGVIDDMVFRVTLTDRNDASRWRLDDEQYLTGKKNFHEHLTLDSVGFSFSDQPFSMKFNSTKTDDEILISTEERTLVMFDKYLEIGFRITS